MKAQKQHWQNEPFVVTGILTILWMNVDLPTVPLDILGQIIGEIDRKYPWVTPKEQELESPPRIKYDRSDGGVVVSITPHWLLRSTQFYAFHRYVSNIAEHLTKTDKHNICSVNVGIEIRQASIDQLTYRTPAGEKVYGRVCEIVHSYFYPKERSTNG
jgi:hypothetical protein